MPLHRGKLASPLPEIKSLRPLTREDLELIKTPRKANVVETFKDSHHYMARLCAAGLRPEEVARRTGYTVSRVYVMRGSPAFQELVAKYREVVDESFRLSQDEYADLAVANMLKAERMLADKLDKAIEENETLPVRDLIAIGRDAADRFGYGKKSTNLNVNVDFAAKLESAYARSAQVIDGRATPLAPASPSASAEPGHATPPLRRRA